MGKSMTKKKNTWKYGDCLIVAVILLCAIFLSFGFSGNSTPQGLTVSVDGEVIGSYTLPLSSEYALESLTYPCALVIDGYAVSLKDTTCPGHDCELGGTIEQAGESIVCLPNRLLLTLSGDAEIDAVTQ